MKIFRGFHHPDIAPACALTIGNFDGVHRGHQAMLALLQSEARHRRVPVCVMTFEPHPRDYFAAVAHKPDLAPARIATLRDKLQELEHCGVDQVVVLPFDQRLASQSPEAFIDEVLVRGLGVRYVLVGDDFRFGAKRAGDYDMLDARGEALGFDVARMNSYEVSDPQARRRQGIPAWEASGFGALEGDSAKVRGLRVSSSAVRQSLAEGRLDDAARLLGRPYAISGHVVHGRRLGRELGASAPGKGDGFRTLNLRFSHWKPAVSGIFAVRVFGLCRDPHTAVEGVANMGIRPSLDASDVNGGRVLLETHCFNWPAEMAEKEAYGKIIRVELLHKLHDELKYDGLDSLTKGIAKDCDSARTYFASLKRP
jgi:riboflavin kinase/FMN adenylyltransferase